MPLPKSKSQQAEDLLVASEIAKAVSFAAHLRVGPHEKYTTRDLASYEAAKAEGDRLVAQHSRFGRRALIWAINAKGKETLCTPELVELARSL